MCGGPTDEEKTLSAKEAAFYQKQMDAYDKAYSQFTDITSTLKKQFEPIINAGPGQMGYTQAQLSNLNTLAGQGTAEQYDAATRAIQQRTAAMGGSITNQTGGPAQQEAERMAALSARQQSQQRLQIQNTGYDIGRAQYQGALTGLNTLAGEWNPNSFSSSAVGAGNSAATLASTIAQQQTAAWGNVLGAVGGVAGAALGNPAGLMGAFKGLGGGGGGGGSGMPVGDWATKL